VFFLTLCCEERGKNSLCHDSVAGAVFETVSNRVERGAWYPYVVLLMPDHVHMLVAFPLEQVVMRNVVRGWKDWIRKRCAIRWQRGFFEHRLRSDESRQEKADYILNNPVRKGLVANWEDWPYLWFPEGRGSPSAALRAGCVALLEIRRARQRLAPTSRSEAEVSPKGW